MKFERIASWSAVALIGLIAFGIPETATRAQLGQVSPLAQYPGFGHNSAADEARYRREQAARQSHISGCMTTLGFNYSQVTEQTNSAPMVRGQQQAALPPTANAQYVASLPADRRLAYNRALYGVDDPNDPSALWDPQSESGGGCWGDALRTYPGVYAARSASAEELAEMRLSIFDDPAVRAADQRWAACMQARGHQISSVRDVVTSDGPEETQAHMGQCQTTSGLQTAISQAAVGREAEFVSRHKARLDAIGARIAAQPALD